MNFEWDEAKNRKNIRKHGIDFADAPEVFAGPMLVRLDTREDYGEDRWLGIGLLRGRAVFVAFAESEPDLIRIISVRKANQNERREFEKAIQGFQD